MTRLGDRTIATFQNRRGQNSDLVDSRSLRSLHLLDYHWLFWGGELGARECQMIIPAQCRILLLYYFYFRASISGLSSFLFFFDGGWNCLTVLAWQYAFSSSDPALFQDIEFCSPTPFCWKVSETRRMFDSLVQSTDHEESLFYWQTYSFKSLEKTNLQTRQCCSEAPLSSSMMRSHLGHTLKTRILPLNSELLGHCAIWLKRRYSIALEVCPCRTAFLL